MVLDVGRDLLAHGGDDQARVALVRLGGGEERAELAVGDLVRGVEVLALHGPVRAGLVGALGHDVDARVVTGAQRVLGVVPAPHLAHDLPHLGVVSQEPRADALPKVALLVLGALVRAHVVEHVGKGDDAFLVCVHGALRIREGRGAAPSPNRAALRLAT